LAGHHRFSGASCCTCCKCSACPTPAAVMDRPSVNPAQRPFKELWAVETRILRKRPLSLLGLMKTPV
jgi:hypothetical protein